MHITSLAALSTPWNGPCLAPRLGPARVGPRKERPGRIPGFAAAILPDQRFGRGEPHEDWHLAGAALRSTGRNRGVDPGVPGHTESARSHYQGMKGKSLMTNDSTEGQK